MQLGAAPRSLAQPCRSRSVTCMSARVDKCNKRSVVVSPSILSANFAKLGEQARLTQRKPATVYAVGQLRAGCLPSLAQEQPGRAWAVAGAPAGRAGARSGAVGPQP